MSASTVANTGSAKTERSSRDFIQELRSFRPKDEKKGNVISTNSTRTMELRKSDASTMADAKKLGEQMLGDGDPDLGEDDEDSGEDDEDAPAWARKSKTRGAKRKAPKPEKEDDRPDRAERPRLSKRQRHSQKKAGKVEDTFDGFDVKVDGVDLGDASLAETKKKTKVDQFYLSVERDPRGEAKERGLDMEQYQMDMVGDEDGKIKSEKSVIRWDAKKKKYLPVMIAADGRVVKRPTKMTNESGVRVNGELEEKSSIYKKWAKSARKRVQKVGEMEEFEKPLGMRAQQKLARDAAANSVEFGDDGEAKKESERERKPIVPFHGKIDAQHLTHKQKRMLKKRESNDSVMSTGSAKKEVLNAEALKKDKKKKLQEKLRQKPALRRAKAKAAKAAYAQKQEERNLKQGRTKSKMLVFEGPVKAKKTVHKMGFMKNRI